MLTASRRGVRSWPKVKPLSYAVSHCFMEVSNSVVPGKVMRADVTQPGTNYSFFLESNRFFQYGGVCKCVWWWSSPAP